MWARNLAGKKGFAPQRRLVIKEDAVTGKKVVGLAIVYRDPIKQNLAKSLMVGLSGQTVRRKKHTKTVRKLKFSSNGVRKQNKNF